MPNLEGPRASRRVLCTVMVSVVMYEAPLWAGCLDTDRARAITVFGDAAGVLAGIPPLHVLARERAEVYRATKDGTTMRDAKMDAREELRQSWQTEWSRSAKGNWTRSLIPTIREWTTRTHGETYFHLTQALSGHGCFAVYLKKIGRGEDGQCDHCNSEPDDAEHTLVRCTAWEEGRRQVEA
ncbi:uncharacterized protein LOC105702561 [Orussus abietinus]|uniref:uncharacterized protein LOC105702561 n=1 Tax=Orussus abietinus TaxID=222816 RepID=UPI0006266050|nr:uncharacterized protein LOC105702561 [Orussus abietinus]